MKTKLCILGAILTLSLAALLETPPKENSFYYNILDEQSVDADAQTVRRAVAYDYEFMLDDMRKVNGNIVETYREYAVHRDEDGNIIVRIPTSNYQYIKYETD